MCDFDFFLLITDKMVNDVNSFNFKKTEQISKYFDLTLANDLLHWILVFSYQHLRHYLLKIINLGFKDFLLLYSNYLLTSINYYLRIMKKQVKAIHFNFVMHLIPLDRDKLIRSYSFSNLSFFIINIAFNSFFSLAQKYAQLINLQYQPC